MNIELWPIITSTLTTLTPQQRTVWLMLRGLTLNGLTTEPLSQRNVATRLGMHASNVRIIDDRVQRVISDAIAQYILRQHRRIKYETTTDTTTNLMQTPPGEDHPPPPTGIGDARDRHAGTADTHTPRWERDLQLPRKKAGGDPSTQIMLDEAFQQRYTRRNRNQA